MAVFASVVVAAFTATENDTATTVMRTKSDGDHKKNFNRVNC
jgi:hypothetical protein